MASDLIALASNLLAMAFNLILIVMFDCLFVSMVVIFFIQGGTSV